MRTINEMILELAEVEERLRHSALHDGYAPDMVHEALSSLSGILDYVVHLGVTLTLATRTDIRFTVTGIPKQKTQREQHDERIQLAAIVDVLDHGLNWHGSWGSTRAAIELELMRLADERAKGGDK